jgi:NTE family protein
MLQALAQHGVSPDLVIGTSVGALNGIAVALDPNGAANRLSHLWPKIRRQMIFPGGPLGQLRTLQRGKTHLFPNTGLRSVIAATLPAGITFADTSVPFGVVTTDAATAAPHVVTAGPVAPALLASAAVPGIFPAVRLDDRQLYDGGLVANVPVTQALALGARSLVVLDAIFPGRLPITPTTLPEALLFTAIVAMRSQARLEIPAVATQVPVVYLPGPDIHRVPPLEFKHTNELIEAAYTATRPFLESLQIDGPGLYGPLEGEQPAHA